MVGLSKDTVDVLRKKVEGRVKKVETHRSGQKPGWEIEVDKLVAGKYSFPPPSLLNNAEINDSKRYRQYINNQPPLTASIHQSVHVARASCRFSFEAGGTIHFRMAGLDKESGRGT